MSSSLDIPAIRAEFPILSEPIRGQSLVYLDNAATSQKPRVVLEASKNYYEHLNSNIHRGTHYLSQQATAAHEAARETIAEHLNAESADSIIFTSGTTDSINLVANILGFSGRITVGSEILVSGLEHHSNIVPWQLLAERTHARLRVIPVLEDGTLDLSELDSLINESTAIVAVNHVSNAFGTINQIQKIITAAKSQGTLTLIDGAQSVPHMAVDVQDLDCDFYVFSGHKIYAPTGIGILYGRKSLLTDLPPWRGGGEMIKEVSFEGTTYNELPFKYEAGTPNIEGGISLAAAIKFVNELGLENIAQHEHHLLQLATDGLRDQAGVKIYADLEDKAAVLSFNVEGVHHYDLGSLIDQMGVAVRTGHHCCQPLMSRFDISGTVRASFAVSNDESDVEAFLEATKRAIAMLR